MKVKPINYFLKSFEEIGLIGKHFNVYDNEGDIVFKNCYINENGYVCYGEDGRELWAITMELLTGLYYYEIISNKKKLRDLTEEEWNKWKNEDCVYCDSCDDCPFRNVPCTKSSSEKSWFNNKELYSDKFLNQEIEAEEWQKIILTIKRYLRY